MKLLDAVENLVPLFVIVALVGYFGLNLAGQTQTSVAVIFTALVVGTIPLIIDMIEKLRAGFLGVDLLALVAITASLLLQEYLTGAVILLMLSGGQFLENYALTRSRRELKTLLQKAPHKANVRDGNEIKTVQVHKVKVGDIIVIKPGEVVPVDARVIKGKSLLDESALTGESLPVDKTIHQVISSGSINLDNLLEAKVLRISSDSKYQQIVRLVEKAEKERAPFVRLADRYSLIFTVIAFSIAGFAFLISGDPVRALTVLVVATPCPLILATPIAFTSGISKAARKGIIIKSGGVIEQLSKAKAFVFDKTGTLTLGVPKVLEIYPHGSEVSVKELLRIAASVEQFSQHILAKALVAEAKTKSIILSSPDKFDEEFGEGVKAIFEGSEYFIGKAEYVQKQGADIGGQILKDAEESRLKGELIVFISRKNKLIGAIHLADSIRSGVKKMFANLEKLGIQKTVMLTGDREQVARKLSFHAGINEYKAECLPEDKVREIKALKKLYSPLVMVGDGINDAPALVTADVGIAMGIAGSSASTEAGDAVIMVDDINRITGVITLSRQVMTIARQGIYIGIGLSTILMFMGAAGLFKPVSGALAQELIDVLVIINALRVHSR